MAVMFDSLRFESSTVQTLKWPLGSLWSFHQKAIDWNVFLQELFHCFCLHVLPSDHFGSEKVTWKKCCQWLQPKFQCHHLQFRTLRSKHLTSMVFLEKPWTWVEHGGTTRNHDIHVHPWTGGIHSFSWWTLHPNYPNLWQFSIILKVPEWRHVSLTTAKQEPSKLTFKMHRVCLCSWVCPVDGRMIFLEFCKVKTIQNSERERERERERHTEKRQWLSTGLLKPQSLRITVTDADDIFLHSQILLQARKDIADMYIYDICT